MGIQLTTEELATFLAHAKTLILTTLRADGAPVSLPMWFVARDGAIYMLAPAASRKVEHVRRDGRVACVVEAGTRWLELRAVTVVGRCSVVADPAEAAAVRAAWKEKYAADEPSGLPPRLQAYYDLEKVVLKVVPERLLSWDNRKIRPSG